MTRGALWALGVASLWAGGVAWAQGPPLCAQLQVNTYTTGRQVDSAVATAADGRFVVVWASYDQDGSGPGVFGQRFAATGGRLGPEFRVNTYTTSLQRAPDVAFGAQGSFVVVWQSDYQDGSVWGVFGQRFDAEGVPQGPEFQVNSTTLLPQSDPRIASDASGNFLVAWQGGGLFGQRFDSSGTPQGAEFRLNPGADPTAQLPSVAMAANGNFVVVWTDYGRDGSQFGVSGQRFDAAGNPLGGEFIVNTYTTGSQSLPSVASDASGNFAVVWSSTGQNLDVFGQRFDSAGSRQGGEFRVNTYTTGSQSAPTLAFNRGGGFVVVWTSGQDGSYAGVFGQQFGPAGAPVGAEFQVNEVIFGAQRAESVAPTANGGFVVSWRDEYDPFDQLGGVVARLDCAGTGFHTVTPCRVADTRNAGGPSGGPALAANTTRSFPVSGLCGVPADARSVVFNVTAVNPSVVGDLRLYPTDQGAPNASALNFAAGRTRANNAVVPLGTDGHVTVQCDMPGAPTGTTHLVLDVFGYFKR